MQKLTLQAQGDGSTGVENLVAGLDDVYFLDGLLGDLPRTGFSHGGHQPTRRRTYVRPGSIREEGGGDVDLELTRWSQLHIRGY